MTRIASIVNQAGRRAKTALLGMLTLLTVLSTVLVPQAAHAQVDPNNAVTAANTGYANVSEHIRDGLVEAAVVSVVNGVNYFTSQLAYSLAVSLTSDCPGQVVCWDSKSFSSGFRQAWQGAIGESVGSLSEQAGFTALGFNLCYPGDLFALRIQLGKLDELKPPPPKCDFNRLVSSWADLTASATSGQILTALKPTFQQGQAPLSVSLGVVDGLLDQESEAQRNSIMKGITDAAAGAGFSPITDPVSGRVKAPGAVAQNEFESMRQAQFKEGKDYSVQIAAGEVAKGAVAGVVVNTVQTFAQTLVARLFNKLADGLLSTEELISSQPDLILNPEGLLNPAGSTAVSVGRFNTQAKPRDAGVVDPLLDFSVCPSSNRGPNNCVIDQQFANAVRVADATPITVRAAIDQGMLHGDWALIPSSAQVKDQDPFCYTYAYCESNLRKLRGARVISIGWELAAAKANPNGGTTLKEVVDGFDDCNDQGGSDENHRWCHLIDPDWVLKAPPAQCRALAFGATLLSDSLPTRAEQCVDTQTCLKQDDSGACIGGWGYCAAEKNVWRFNGDACPAPYNSCRTLTSRTGETVNFLLNTIDHGVCNADNAGCQQYSLAQNAVTCTMASACGTASGCSCTVTRGTCTVAFNQTSCTAANGTVCRQSAACTVANGCACTNTVSCTVASGQRSCQSVVGTASAADDWQQDPSRFLNKNAQSCDPANNGCTALVKLDTNQSLNMLRNGSFEEVEDGDGDLTPDHARYWTPDGESGTSTNSTVFRKDGAHATTGANSVHLPTLGQTALCTSATGTCTADQGCACMMTSGPLLGSTCKVVKGRSTCPVTSSVLQNDIPMRRGVTYTVSYSLIPDSGNVVNGGVSIKFENAAGQNVSLSAANVTAGDPTVTGGTLLNSTCAASGGGFVFSVNGVKAAEGRAIRAACTFVVDGTDFSLANLRLYATGSGITYMDDVQLEEGGGTEFHEGYGSAQSASPVAIKVPPSYLGCAGDDTDRPECDAFAGVCRDNEVGCDRYTPSNGDPAVPGIVGPQDRCPAECSGYDVFKQEESPFDAAKFPVYFIPSTAQSCTATEAGCSEFTNVQTEQVSYYAGLRLCVAPTDPTAQTYYSWEGSDTTGFQLRVWALKTTTDASNVTRNVAPGASDTCATAGCASVGPAPCTKLDGSATACASVNTALTGGSTEGLCTRADIDGGNFDCREFYDATGNRHYRLLSKTVVASASCSQYRITTSTQFDCTKSNGRWDVDRSQCVYSFDAAQSNQCAAAQNGCRAYKGNAATNVREAAGDDFENGVRLWSGTNDNDAIDQSDSIELSSESVTVGGHSLKIKASGTHEARLQVGGSVAPLRSYSVSFWARGSGSLTVGFAKGTQAVQCLLPSSCNAAAGGTCGCTTPTGLTCNVNAGAVGCMIPAAGSGVSPVSAQAAPAGSLNFADTVAATSAPSITLTSEWKRYELGPVIVAAPPTGQPAWGSYSSKLRFVSTADAFIDNVSLSEVQDNIFVVRDSWRTPLSCDQTALGTPSPQEMLGCREYRSQVSGGSVYLRSFTNLCREQAIGCAAYSSTQNTVTNPYAESFNAVCRLTDASGAARKCGVRTCNLSCNSAGGCTCTDPGGAGSCVVSSGGTSCDIAVPADAGASCTCDYDTKNPAYGGAGASQYQSDVCRVAIGQSECRFNLDGWDNLSRADENPDRVNVPADQRLYLVASASNQCDAAQISCKAVGRAHYSYEADCSLPATGTNISNGTCVAGGGCTCGPMNGATCTVLPGERSCKVSFEKGIIDRWDTVTIKDDPSRYAQALCGAETLACEEYHATDGTYYFKNPGDKTCEFRENVNVGGSIVSGFFRKSESGALFACYPELLRDGNFYSMYKNADSSCTLPNVSSGSVAAGRCTSAAGCPCYIAPNPLPACRVAKGNTTCGYQGWVGQCQPQFDRCEEFVDPAHTSAAHPDGEPYYYIVNNKLDLKSCSGKASLSQGCVLFKQTSNTQNLYSASASYARSEAEANGGLVAPVNCNTDPRNPACENRCVSIPKGTCSEDSSKSCVQDTEDAEKGCPGATNHCTGTKLYGSGCAAANGDRDCNGGVGEVCASIRHCSGSALRFCDSNADCSGVGTCLAAATPNVIPRADNAATRNDSNVILKVRPDRECAEWLACQSYESVFDPQQGKYRPRCTAFTLCSGTSSATSNQLECQNAVTPPKKPFTAEDYANRDVTWSGLEYSGYTVPDRYPAQYLSPVTVVQGRCFATSGCPVGQANCAIEPYAGCSVTADCGQGQFCKQLSGVCRGDVEDRSCDSNLDCGTGYCSTSYFDTHRFGVLLDASYSCNNDSECAAGATGQTDDGSCVDHRCYYDYAGGKFNVTASDTQAQCRAYPEADAPYGSSVIADASATAAHGYDPLTYEAVSRKKGYTAANTCLYNNDCECSYKKLQYGPAGGTLRYVGMASATVMPNSASTDQNGVALAVTGAASGICSGGPHDGWTCNASADCTEGDDRGTCQKLTRVSSAQGWAGFCMDQDLAHTINGNQDQFNCNLWLPVDQLAGAPDSFNQYREAGFQTDAEDLLYCAVAQGNAAGTDNYVVTIANADDGAFFGLNSVFGSSNDLDKHTTALVDKNWYKSQITAIAFEFTAPRGTNGITTKMFLAPENNWEGAFGFNNGQNGIGNGNVAKGSAEAVGGNNAKCLDMIENGNEGDCESMKDPNNCVAARAYFDPDGKLNTMRTLVCNTDSGDGYVIPARMRIFFREACTEVVQVHDDTNPWTPNFAWTDRLWKGLANGSIAQLPPSFAYSVTTDRPNADPKKLAPFGPITPELKPVDFGGTETLPVRWPIPVYKSEGGSAFTRYRAAVSGPQNDANPGQSLPCATTESDTDPSSSATYTTPCDNGYTLAGGDPGDANAAASDMTQTKFTAAGIPFSCVGDCLQGDSSARGAGTGFDRLASIFVQAWKRFTWSGGNQDVQPPAYEKTADTAYDRRSQNVSPTTKPRVVPPLTGNCDPANEGLCEEGTTDGMEVSGIGNLATTSGSLQALGGRAQVVLKYYAWADSDHMPLRRRIVDFGDRTPLVSTPGWYKNHRGCANGTVPCRAVDEICQNGAEDFGDTTQACESRYFQDSHTYTCSPGLVASLPACGDPNNSATYPCADSGSCVFKPRVQFLDNWGVCNGSCPGGAGSGDVCFNAASDLSLLNPIASAQVTDAPGRNECYGIDSRTEGDYQYAPPGGGPISPWTAFGGVIRVQP